MAMPEKALRKLRLIAAQGAAKDLGKPKDAAEMTGEGDAVDEGKECTCPKCGHEGPLEEFQAGDEGDDETDPATGADDTEGDDG